MNKIIHSNINILLKRFGFILQECEQEWEREAFAKLYESRIKYVKKSCAHSAEGIVFSKDRALQLHALLSSYLEKAVSPVPFHILYHASTSEHQLSYEKLKELFSNKFSFIKQSSNNSFRADLIELLDSVLAEKTFFLVDDILFIENFDINDFTKFDTDKMVPSLRMGLNLKKCYTVQKEQPLPEFISYEGNDEGKIFWKWNQGLYDWAYPLSVDGHFFSTQEIIAMTKLIQFSAPNTYEDQLQKFRRFFLFRKGVGYKKARIVNIPCNKVQKENKNICGNTHQDFLLEQWLNGFQMDYRRLYGFPNISVHQEIPFEFIQR
ncbi:MAG: hypothetical protein PHC61_16955 [Chitinivibrionales bacterium]|nr:hypothetical protein [Chitinivibrionales bacterium]